MQCPNGCNTAGTDCATCPTGQTSCPMGCRDLMHDPMNCGQCDNICPAPAANTGIPVCISSMCNVQCNTGYLACDPSQAICQRTLWDFEDATLEGWKILATPTAAGKPMVNNAGGHSGKFSLLVPLDATGQMRQFDAGPLICAGKGVSKVVSTVIAWVALVPSGTPSAPGRGSYIGLRITSESGDTLTKINVPAYNEWFQLKAPLPAGDVQLLQFAVEGLLAPPDIITVNPDWTGAIYIDDVQIQ
jgi:hypothetical protein